VGERADIVPIPQLHCQVHPKKPQPAGEEWRFRFTIVAKNPFGPAADSDSGARHHSDEEKDSNPLRFRDLCHQFLRPAETCPGPAEI
jgi:hypothetical protein